MDITRLEKQMQFIKEADKLKDILRQNYLTNGNRRENDAEHSWHLAILVMTLAEYFPSADLLKTIKMVIIHDLVEIYAGDTFAYDDNANLDKEEREKAAADKLFAFLPSDQAEEYKSLWQEFEMMNTAESVFAAIVDRIQPMLLNISTKGKMWLHHKVTFEKVMARNKIVFEKGPDIISEYMTKLLKDAAEKYFFYSEKIK